MNESEIMVDTLPLLMTVAELSKVLRIGRNKCYELIRSNQIRSIRLGKSIRIPRTAIYEFLESGADSGSKQDQD